MANYRNDKLVVYLIVVKSIIQDPIETGELNGSIFFHEMFLNGYWWLRSNITRTNALSIQFDFRKTFFIWVIRYVPISDSFHSFLICFEKFSNIWTYLWETCSFDRCYKTVCSTMWLSFQSNSREFCCVSPIRLLRWWKEEHSLKMSFYRCGIAGNRVNLIIFHSHSRLE